MRRKYRASSEGTGNSWIITYAGLITLLMVFFAVLLSISSVNQEKYDAFISSFSGLPQETQAETVKPSANTGAATDTITDNTAPDVNSAQTSASPDIQYNVSPFD